MPYTLQTPTNVKHWVVVVPLLSGPKGNVEEIQQALDSQGEGWVLRSTEVHQDYLYLFLVLEPRINVVEIYKPPAKEHNA